MHRCTRLRYVESYKAWTNLAMVRAMCDWSLPITYSGVLVLVGCSWIKEHVQDIAGEP
jgi:hypothetical protein